MTREELKNLFIKYLKRDYSEQEWLVHGKKNFNYFEKEISECQEYRNLIIKNKLNIAILISGHIRKNSILNGILKFCNDNKYHVFVHTWDNLGIKGSETSTKDPIVKNKVESELLKYPNLKKYEIENNNQWISSQENKSNYFNFSSPEVFIKSQLYSINKSYKLMEEYSIENNIKYDIVFKFRFDCNINKFNISDNLKYDIINNDIIFTPNKDNRHDHPDYGTSCWACDNMYYRYNLKNVHIFEHTNIVCDLFAYGNFNSMKKYTDLYHNYDNINESFFEDNLKQYNKFDQKKGVYQNGNYYFNGFNGHLDSLYYFNCSYPERVMQKYLRDYMLVESREIKLELIR
jgi:hypothetical protein